MKPLQSIGMGFVLLLLVTRLGGYDLYADPLGWLLVLNGLRLLPEIPLRGALLYVGVLATLVSVPLWVPAVVERLDEAEPAVAWAVNLPRFGFFALLAVALARAAAEAGDRRAAAWYRTTTLGAVALVVLPVLVFGAGLTALENAAGASVVIVPLVLLVLLFWHSGRTWARAPAAAPAG